MSPKPAADPMSETPTPWRADNLAKIRWAGDDGKGLVAVCHDGRYYGAVGTRENIDVSRANAELIVLAVNSHATLLHQRDALVKALEDCPLPSQSAPTGEFYGRFYAWYNGQREAAIKVKE